jgi:YidC/Oxa1 family membrane protein insertase
MEERRLLLALGLSILLMTAWSYLFAPKPAPRPPLPSPSAPSDTGAPAATSVTPTPSPVPEAPAVPKSTAPPPNEPQVADSSERRVEVEAPTAIVAFTNRGARLISWQLKAYRDSRGRGEEMVPAGRGAPRPLDLETGDADVDARLREALFKPSAEALTVPKDGEAEVRFVWAEGDLAASKSFRFKRDGQLVAIEANVRRGGRDLPLKLLWGPGLGNPSDTEKEVQGYLPPQGVVLAASGVQRFVVKDVVEPQRFAPVRWIGLESQYFAALFVPAASGAGEVRVVTHPVVEGQAEKAVVAAVDLQGGPAELFVGPKDYHALNRLGHGLASVVPVGEWIGPIVVPLLSLLRWVHGHVGNYGWSIVALTVVINLLMAPLRHYSIANGLKMAKLGPEIRAIQERYRKVPLMERGPMNEEIAKVYSKHGMSMSTQMTVGCLPLLLTMPFLIAFYRVLQVAIDLKGASFLWIPDLAQKDPLFLTPILMGASMLVMQRLTPTGTMDPAQQRMLMLMPVVLTVMFVAAPAGLNLYWLASNLCSIVQQGVTMRLLKDRMQEAQAPERKKKK